MPPDPRTSAIGLAALAFACGGATNTHTDREEGDSVAETGGASGIGASSEAEPDGTSAEPEATSTQPEAMSPEPEVATGGSTDPVNPDDDIPTDDEDDSTGVPVPIDDTEPDPSTEPEPLCSNEDLVGSDSSALSMAPFAVDHDRYAFRTLFSWTVPEQVDELRADPTLLTRAASASGERGRASTLIAELASENEIAALLARPEYANKRFAWTNPWATLMGYPGEDFGDRLIAITLRSEAIVGRMTIDEGGNVEFQFQDMDGNLVPNADVLQNPERLAAVYFVDARLGRVCAGTLASIGDPFREVFICNEAMLESWALFTPEIREELDRGVSALEAFLSELENSGCDPLSSFDECWSQRVASGWGLETPGTVVELYEAALAFPNGMYAPTAQNLTALIDRLLGIPLDEAPLVHRYDE